MHFVRSAPEDAATLTRIAFLAKEHWGYPQRWMESWRSLLTLTPDFIAEHATYAAVEGDRIVGFYALVSADEGGELAHFWVVPEAMGQGVGRRMFAHALERARELGYRSLVIESDPNAEGFYRKMGARRVGARITEVDGQRRELPVLASQLV